MVVLEFLIGFTVALMLNAVERGKNVYYLILLFPLLMNPVVVGLIWRMFLHPVLGIVNYLLSLDRHRRGELAGRSDQRVLDAGHGRHLAPGLVHGRSCCWPDSRPCRASPTRRRAWRGPRRLQTFLHVTLPLMRPVIMVTLLIRLIFAIRTYDLVYIMTRGGPGQATDLVSYFIYRQAFVGLNIGQAAALSVILLLIVLALTAYLYRYMRSLA